MGEEGNLFASIHPDAQGLFKFEIVPDGIWIVRIRTTWMNTIERRVEVRRRQKVDLGSIPVSFSLDNVIQRELVPQFGQIVDAALTSDGSIWAVGFQTSKGYRNTRKIMCKRPDDTWKEVVVPQLSTAERAYFIHELSGSRLIIGSLGAGGAISNDMGKTWKSVALPEGVDSLMGAIELPDHSIVAHGWEWCRGHPKNAVILKYLDDLSMAPKVTSSIENCQFSEMMITEPGRILIGKDSISKDAGILVSEDFGDSWTAATVFNTFGQPNSQSFRGVTSFLELSDTILAGTYDGIMIRPDHAKCGMLLATKSGGTDWNILIPKYNFGDTIGLCKISDATIALFTREYNDYKNCKLRISSDNGTSWKEFLDLPISGPHPRLKVYGNKCLLFGMSNITIIDKSFMSLTRFS